MPEMTPIEAAEKLESIAYVANGIVPEKSGNKKLVDVTFHVPADIKALKLAASLLRKIASGEYAPVVHGYITGHGYDLHCSNCEISADIGNNYCPNCGCVMDGKGDNSEME